MVHLGAAEFSILLLTSIIQSWNFDSTWKYHLTRVSNTDTTFIYDVMWSIPTRRRPIPTATASVRFTVTADDVSCCPFVHAESNRCLSKARSKLHTSSRQHGTHSCMYDAIDTICRTEQTHCIQGECVDEREALCSHTQQQAIAARADTAHCPARRTCGPASRSSE